MTKTFLPTAGLLLLALPAFAQAPAKSLTPPEILGAAKTIQFTATLYRNDKPVEISYATLAQPNRAYVVDEDFNTRAVDRVYVSDGKTQTEYRASRNSYTQSAAAASIGDIDSRTVALSALAEFYDMDAFRKFQAILPEQTLYEKPLGQQDGHSSSELLMLALKTGLPQRVDIQASVSPRQVESIEFSHWKLNAPVDDSNFAYTPPAGAKLYVAPQVLASGTTAPNFTVQDKEGKPVKLSDYKGKTVVLDFWATWCGPCQSSLPHTTAMAKKYAGKNVVVLAVNVWDTPAAFQSWLPKHPEYAPLHFAIDPNSDQSKSVASALYGVSGIPTQYVIGPDGKIVKSIVGYETGDTQLEDALKTTAAGN